MSAPDMAEVEWPINEFGASCDSAAKRGHIASFKPLGQQIVELRAAHTALLDAVRAIAAERDQFRDAAKMVSAAPQPVGEVPLPERTGHFRNGKPRNEVCYCGKQMRDGQTCQTCGYTLHPQFMEVPMLEFALFDELGKGADDRVQEYGEQCRAAGVIEGAKHMFDALQFAAANTSDTEWDERLCEYSEIALESVSPEAHTEWKTIQRVAKESHQQGYAAGVAALVSLKPQSGVNPDGTARHGCCPSADRTAWKLSQPARGGEAVSDDKCQCDIPEDECGFPECRAACDRVRADGEIATLRAQLAASEARAERMKIRADTFEAAYNVANRATFQPHNAHWDSTGGSGRGCLACQAAREAREQCDDILLADVKWQIRKEKCTNCRRTGRVGEDRCCICHGTGAHAF